MVALFKKLSPAITGAEEVLAALSDFSQGFVLRNVGIADFVFDHDPLDRAGFGGRFPAPGKHDVYPDKQEDDIENEYQKKKPKQSGDHLSNLIHFQIQVNGERAGHLSPVDMSPAALDSALQGQ